MIRDKTADWLGLHSRMGHIEQDIEKFSYLFGQEYDVTKPRTACLPCLACLSSRCYKVFSCCAISCVILLAIRRRVPSLVSGAPRVMSFARGFADQACLRHSFTEFSVSRHRRPWIGCDFLTLHVHLTRASYSDLQVCVLAYTTQRTHEMKHKRAQVHSILNRSSRHLCKAFGGELGGPRCFAPLGCMCKMLPFHGESIGFCGTWHCLL